MDDVSKLADLIKGSRKILITSHISPDPDSICSVLLLGSTLKLNYPDKEVTVNLEEKSDELDFLSDYKNIIFHPIQGSIESFQPDVLIMLDSNNYDRCSRRDGDKIRTYINQTQIKTVIIDHHEPTNKDVSDIYINLGNIAVVQDAYEICFETLKLNKPKDHAYLTMLGLYSDSGGFTYTNKNHRKTFKIVSDLIDQGVSLEEIKNKLNSHNEDHMKVIGELASNVSHEKDYSYSFVNDSFVRIWQDQNKSMDSFGSACKFFIDQYIRNIEDRRWGFIVYRDLLAGEAVYGVSLRSIGAKPDVSIIAARLRGGGHKAAAGAKFQAQNVEEAIKKVQQTIS